jgi:WXXGXW repeat (2 copies)
MTRYGLLAATAALALAAPGLAMAQAPVVMPGAVTVVPAPDSPPVWISGHWQWSEAAQSYIWVSGRYARTAWPSATWIPGGWVLDDGGWVYRGGHWYPSSD